MNPQPKTPESTRSSYEEVRALVLDLLRQARNACAEPPRDSDPQYVIDVSQEMIDARQPLLMQIDAIFSDCPELTQDPLCRGLVRELHELGARWGGALESARHTLNLRRVSLARVRRGRNQYL